MWSTPPLSRCILDPRRPLGAPFRAAIDDRINDFLDAAAGRLGDLQPEIGPLLALTSRLLAGGKRLRPAFCAWGYVAAAGSEHDEPARRRCSRPPPASSCCTSARWCTTT